MKGSLSNFFFLGHLEDSPDENYITTIFCQAIAASIFTNILLSLVFHFIAPTPGKDIIILILIFSTFIMMISLLLHFHKKIYLGRALFLITSCLTVSSAQFITIDYFLQSGAIIAVLAGIHGALINRPHYRIVSYLFVLVIYISSLLIHNWYFDPVDVSTHFPHGAILFLIIIVFSISRLYDFYHKIKEQGTQKLKSKNLALSQATTDIERFTYIASHDLKAPLVNINVLLDMVDNSIKNKMPKDIILEKLAHVNQNSQKMKALIEGILTLSELEEELRNIKKESVNFTKVIDSSKEKLSSLINDKNATIVTTDLPGSFTYRKGIQTVFDHIIQNAIIYNKSPKPIVQISFEETAEHLTFAIKDNGIGVDQKNYQVIFEHFKRLDIHNGYQGIGLGLSVSKKIVETLDGKIWINSAPNKTTTFSVQLPKTPLS